MQPVEPQTSIEFPVERPHTPWYQKLGAVLFILICFEVGIFLVIFPWMEYWNQNWIANLAPWMRDLWDSSFFRGALSGLGLLNIYISLAEVLRFRRPPADKLKVPAL
jgi:hypothetical protein